MKKRVLIGALAAVAVLTAAVANIRPAIGAEKTGKDVPAQVEAFHSGVLALLPAADQYDAVETGAYRILSAENQQLGTVYLEKISDTERQFGYAGTIEVAILFKADGRVAGVLLGKNQETPSFLNRIRGKKFLESWNELEMKDIPGREVDAVTGATLSSAAIRTGVRKLAADYLAATGDQTVGETTATGANEAEEIARLEKRIAMTKRILTGSERLLTQLENRKAEELELRLIAATQGAEAAGKFAAEKDMMYFNHPGRNKSKSPIDQAAEKYRETNTDADLAALKEAILDEYDRLLLSVPPHNAEHAKALKASEARLAALREKQAAKAERPAVSQPAN